MARPRSINTSHILQLFDELGSISAVAEKMGVSRQAISQALVRAGLEVPKQKDWLTRFCATQPESLKVLMVGISCVRATKLFESMGYSRRQFEAARFWSKVDRSKGEDACWPWTGKFHYKAGGYGNARLGGKAVYSHHVAWILTHGTRPEKGLGIRHKCGIRACCNPHHLISGTMQDNCHDREMHKAIGRGAEAAQYFD